MRKLIFAGLVLALSSVMATAQENGSPLYDRGYLPSVQVGYAVSDDPYWTIETTHGYRFGNGLFVLAARLRHEILAFYHIR